MNSRLPSWLRQDLPDESTQQMTRLLSESNVHTVCQEAKCPNITACFRSHKVTFIILGDVCTRNCSFCNVKKNSNVRLNVDLDEPRRIAELVRSLDLNYAVITSVTRDDLVDGGASQFVRTIGSIRLSNKEVKVEVLIPDFKARTSSLQCLVDAGPDIIAHNLETVRGKYPLVRPQADYKRSLTVLSKIKEMNKNAVTKSSLMLGLGETEAEVFQAMSDLRVSRVDMLTLGQYLAPSVKHYPVKEFIRPEKFEEYKRLALKAGFKVVVSGPLVRSSYKAQESQKELLLCMT